MKQTRSTNERPTTVRLQKLSWAFTQSAVLFGAIECGFFTAVAKNGDSAESIAEALGITVPNTQRMIVALLTLGLIERDGTGFRNAPDVARFLVQDQPSYAGAWVHWFHHQWGAWGELGQRLQATGEEKSLGFYTEGFTVEHARRYHQATASVGMGAARKFLREVDLTGRRKILDLGGGSGAYSIQAAKQYPEIEAVVLDLPEVVVVSRDFIAEHGVEEQVTAEACDFTSEPFPGGADVILMNSNLPQYSGEVIQSVVKKAFDALVPGGEMHICGEMVNEDWSGPLIPAMCAMHGALFQSTALPHTPTDCIGYFETAGFRDIQVREFIPDILQHITGRKPA
ncbi:MAG: methyltransferase [Proteobacteria bacterium]|nr:methyltransferase [Pseudomonadota bacterium]